ncbi:MAG: molybdopterin-binding protein [Mariprofundales bacterium]
MNISVAIIIIGNEILSGKTRESNAWHAAKTLFERGYTVYEIAIITDDINTIISCIHRLQTQADYIITSGGIGPTHDDVTMQAVADAFNVPLQESAAIVQKLYLSCGQEPSAGLKRMARLPLGAEAIDCDLTLVPGCKIDNVFVLAGVPDIFKAQLKNSLPYFTPTTTFLQHEIYTYIRESTFCQPLAILQQQFSNIEIGSYPMRDADGQSYVLLSLTGKDAESLHKADSAIQQMLQTYK